MRILVVTQYFWPEIFQINNLVKGLHEGGHHVTVLTGKPNYPSGSFHPGYGFFKKNRDDYDGIEVIRVPLLPRRSGAGLHLILNYLSFVFFASVIAPFRCNSDYEVIFVYEPSPVTVGIPALLLKKLKKVPVIFWVQDLWPESLSATGAINSPGLLKLVEGLVRYIYRRCDLILIQSQKFRSSIEKHDVESDKIKYFPNSAEDIYKPVVLQKSAPELDKMPDGFRVMFAGNIGVSQDFNTILDAAEKLKTYSDIHWLILGDGRMLPWVNEQIEKRALSDTFHLLGRHPVKSMPCYFSLADVMLVTLKKELIFSLTVPAKVQSYLACSKPLIAVLDGEGARIVNEAGAGLATEPENSDKLVDAVLEMYHMSEEDRQEMGKRGRQYFELNFQRDKLLEKLEVWLQELTGR